MTFAAWNCVCAVCLCLKLSVLFLITHFSLVLSVSLSHSVSVQSCRWRPPSVSRRRSISWPPFLQGSLTSSVSCLEKKNPSRFEPRQSNFLTKMACLKNVLSQSFVFIKEKTKLSCFPFIVSPHFLFKSGCGSWLCVWFVPLRWRPACTSPLRVAWCAGEKTAASSWFQPHRPPSSSCCRGSTCSGEVREDYQHCSSRLQLNLMYYK